MNLLPAYLDQLEDLDNLDEQVWLNKLYGDRSQLSQLLQRGPLHAHHLQRPDQFVEALRLTAEHGGECLAYANPDDPDAPENRRNLVHSLVDLAKVAHWIQTDPGSAATFEWFQSAASVLSRLFGVQPGGPVGFAGPIGLDSPGGLVAGENSAARFLGRFPARDRTSRGFRIAMDTLLDWCQPDVPRWERQGSADFLTVVHGAAPNARYHLTVELMPLDSAAAGRGELGRLDPDIRFLGMTGVQHGDSQQCFLSAMDEMWRISGLEKNWRGRWRVESLESEHGRFTHTPLFSGRSAEAAAMCLLLNTGHERTDHQRYVIHSKKCISARVDRTGGTDPWKLKLLRAEGAREKMLIARNLYDQVLFAEDEEIVRLDGPMLAKVKRVRTIEEAFKELTFDRMGHREYRERVKQQWERCWSGESHLNPQPVRGAKGV